MLPWHLGRWTDHFGPRVLAAIALGVIGSLLLGYVAAIVHPAIVDAKHVSQQSRSDTALLNEQRRSTGNSHGDAANSTVWTERMLADMVGRSSKQSGVRLGEVTFRSTEARGGRTAVMATVRLAGSYGNAKQFLAIVLNANSGVTLSELQFEGGRDRRSELSGSLVFLAASTVPFQ